ncbi:hypothetical protein Bca52824_021585 [Brassica carinata]|uniref:DUF1985 domain-containing protein n=1 Tax=Brassica carinata TaxID=52824 RepID=A0A8X8AS53_BRACI|nr:hypothetical protein Bca52824_021585 [Brassica carinata]
MDRIVLPPRMFAAGEEPLGERINSYHKIKTTRMIIDALEPDELDFLRKSTFGKILAIDENPPFSGAFGQYIIVRLLKVNKKYEIWILFAGTPVRLSLREYAIVTGLNCGKLPDPAKKKKKNPLNEKLYWNELFGSLKSCTVDTVIGMLKKKIHVEMIRDLDEFLAYPWGRASYLTLITSIVSKDEIALSQTSVAIRGYVDAIQLVLLAAVPQLKEEITLNEPVVIADSDSDGETPDVVAAAIEGNVVLADKPPQANKYCLIPGHAKIIDTDCKLPVMSIIEDPYEEWSTGAHFDFDDETDDSTVDQMVALTEEGFKFRKDMFKGGLTGNDLSRMREVKKPKEKEPKDKLDKEIAVEMTEGETSDSQATSSILQLLASQISDKLSSSSRDIGHEISSFEIRLEKAIDAKMEKIERKLESVLVENLKTMQTSIIKAIGVDVRKDLPPIGINNPVEPNKDNNTPSELADCRINEVLGDLNGLSNANQAPMLQKQTLVPVNPSAVQVSKYVSATIFLFVQISPCHCSQCWHLRHPASSIFNELPFSTITPIDIEQHNFIANTTNYETSSYIKCLDPKLQIGILQVTLLWLAPPHLLHARRRLKVCHSRR